MLTFGPRGSNGIRLESGLRMQDQATLCQVIIAGYFNHVFANIVCTGSGDCEAYNARLDKIMPDKPLALDKMVDFLAEEDKYWCRTMDDSRLKQARKDQKAKSQAAHTAKRRRLSYYRDRSEDVNQCSESISMQDFYREDHDPFSDEGMKFLIYLFWFTVANNLIR